jgi:hypothetical protein
MERRIMDAINAVLTDKGLHEVPLGADIGVVAHIATRERHTLETFYTGFGGGWRWGMGWGQAITTPETYTVGTLVVDLFDARTMQLIWRGVGTETLSDKPEKDTQKLNKRSRRCSRTSRRRANKCGLKPFEFNGPKCCFRSSPFCRC